MLDRSFFARSPLVVAPALIGATLVTGAGRPDEVRAQIVEVEAYLGADDPASHAFRGPTPRSSSMFGPPGHLYVYLSYGVHHCANVVCDADGVAGAVLLRAAAVQSGGAVIRERRARRRGSGALSDGRLLNGPGNLCLGMGIGLEQNGVDLCDPRSGTSFRHTQAAGGKVVCSPRVGISQARDVPWRFVLRDHPGVSVK